MAAAGCRCRPAQQLLLLMLLTTAGLLLIALLGAQQPALSAAPHHPLDTPRVRASVSAPAPVVVRECPPRGRLLSVNAAGRLGNVMSEYATLLAVGRELRRPAWLLPAMSRTLAAHFEPPRTLPTLPTGCHVNWTVTSADKLLTNPPDAEDTKDYLIGGFPHAITQFHPLRDQLLRDFTLRPELRRIAQERLSSLARSADLPSPPTFIGIHVRRTDYGTWLARRVGGRVVGAAYLRQAVALMRRRHPDALFVVVSDDPEWCRRELRGIPRLVTAGDGVQTRPGADLALLAACNHTITTHGTFGFWAAYLAGGEVVAPTRYGRSATGLEIEVRRARLGWSWLRADGRPGETIE